MIQHPLRLMTAAAAVIAAFSMAGCNRPAEVAAAAPAAAASTTSQVSDTDVSEHVKTTLLQTASLKGVDITVVTMNGDVRLTGMVDSQAQKDEALRIARAAEGAHTIHDELSIRK